MTATANPGEASLALEAGHDDVVLPFAVSGLNLRGRVVRLGDSFDTIVSRHGYPAPIARLLGEALSITALLGSSLKFNGRFVLQAQSDGPVSLLVTDLEVPGKLRGYCRYDADAIAAMEAGTNSTNRAPLFGKGHLALTIDQGRDMQQYQGVVPLESDALSDAAHHYFRQSEQIPTTIRVSAGEVVNAAAKGGSTHGWRAGGLLVQYLPEIGGTWADVDPDTNFVDPEAERSAEQRTAQDQWDETTAFMNTVEDHELLDPHLVPTDRLFRLFHERGVRVVEAAPLAVHCKCSRARIGNFLSQFTEEEVQEMVKDDGLIEVICEFCATAYRFEPGQWH